MREVGLEVRQGALDFRDDNMADGGEVCLGYGERHIGATCLEKIWMSSGFEEVFAVRHPVICRRRTVSPVTR